jgi:hypothetical protein
LSSKRKTLIWNDIVMGLRLLAGLPAYLRHPLSVPESRAILRGRLERRNDDFLDLAKRAIFDSRESPYIPLMSGAGCEFGDLERLVWRDGLEAALLALYRSGVYLTSDEYKGHFPAVRGNASVAVDPSRLRNPLMSPQYLATTSGSRGQATTVPLDLACIRDHAVNMHLALDARGGAHWRNAVWAIPAVSPILWYSACGGPAARWFWPIDPRTPGLHPRYRWSARTIAWAGRVAGIHMPAPEYVSPDSPLPIARWMERTLRDGEVPHLWTFPSSASRLCLAAEEAGIDLAGAQFTVTGEPVTDARLSAIRHVGAGVSPDYGSADSGGSAACGCLYPESPDDVHVFSDLNALIQADAAPFPAGSLLLTSIRPTAPFIFLNVSMGDRAVVADRHCGCPVEALGWTTHLRDIRSFEKLTAGGVTFADRDVVSILEEILPRRFGGGPADFQLVEEEAGDGRPRLLILVRPSVPAFVPDDLIDVFLRALGADSETGRVMALQVKEAGFLRVERRAPLATASGKVLHVWSGSAVPPGGSS